MEDRRVLIDASIIIEYLRKTDKTKSLLLKLIKEEAEIKISSITVYELFAGAKTYEKRTFIEEFLSRFIVLDVDFEIARLAGMEIQRLKRMNQMIENADVLIGATALSLGIKIATLNRKHFERIEGLEIM